MDENGKNLITLRDFVEEKFAAQDKATELFQKILDERLESMNRFREDLRTQATQFMTRQEYKIAHDAVMDDIRFLREARANVEGKASQLSMQITFLFSLLSLFVGIVAILHSFTVK